MKVMSFTIGVLFALFSLLTAQSTYDAVRIVEWETGFGTRALAMGGAYTAVANDYSGIYFNPAGLASMKTSQFYGELTHLRFNNQATFQGTPTDALERFTSLGSIGIGMKLPTTRGSFVIGFGYNRVKEFDSILRFRGYNPLSNGLEFELEDDAGNVDVYPFDQFVEQEERVSDEGGLNQWTIGAGIALSPALDMGVSVDFWRGRNNYQLTFVQKDVDNIYTQYPGNFYQYTYKEGIQSDYSATGLKFGLIMKMGQAIRLGATLGLPVTFTVSESYYADDELIFDDGFSDAAELDRGEFKYKVRTPFYADGGIALQNKFITLAASVRFRDWTQTRFVIPEGGLSDPDYAYFSDQNLRFQEEYRATMEYRFGGELRFNQGATVLRGGYMYLPSPLKGATQQMGKQVYTAGVGIQLDEYVRLDVTAMRSQWERESEDELTPGGTLENITADKFFVGIVYNFR